MRQGNPRLLIFRLTCAAYWCGGVTSSGPSRIGQRQAGGTSSLVRAAAPVNRPGDGRRGRHARVGVACLLARVREEAAEAGGGSPRACGARPGVLRRVRCR
ncbi:hypothetical protein GCM10017779_01860 [Streptomyces capillispiralis]|nr:hypothetical protein GCM10017779_01860 [Streptomyces capillispiralis]